MNLTTRRLEISYLFTFMRWLIDIPMDNIRTVLTYQILPLSIIYQANFRKYWKQSESIVMYTKPCSKKIENLFYKVQLSKWLDFLFLAMKLNSSLLYSNHYQNKFISSWRFLETRIRKKRKFGMLWLKATVNSLIIFKWKFKLWDIIWILTLNTAIYQIIQRRIAVTILLLSNPIPFDIKIILNI
jgi:hypothetical protein